MPSQTALATHGKRTAGVARRSSVEPVSRALSLLAAFGPHDLWLGNGELSLRTGLPPSTVSRQGQCLVALGYLHYDAVHRKYRLAASVLALGYAAIAHSEVQRLTRQEIQAFADKHRVHVTLSARDRLDLVLLESAASRDADIPLDLHVGARMSLATSPMGWALLAALPEVERYYLLGNVERRMPREWSRLRRRSNEAISQVHALGYCTSLSEWDPDLGIVAVPLMIPGNAPLVLACVGASSNMSRARVDRCLGPRLVSIAAAIQEQAGSFE
ncbi:MAG TPA: helix-turn-helix domain-containing protein [Ramlibacter sp.]|nr:helix-turn-helix domain-containing protein [Ramlibacter sp.]